ncbi:MAG: ABC transporter ATP-binding protein [Planctomycetota bacterium]
MKILEVDHVSKLFGEFRAVDDVSFTVEEGSITGFLGPNGAGKTTTIRMLLDIYQPTSGRIAVFGKPSALEVRNRIGYLPEEKGLYKKMKTWSIIAYFATLKGLDRKTAKRRAFELLERYGLKDFAEKRTEALSKGMGQKVQVLASIAHDPELVIFDEPFSGLDPVNQQVLEQLISDLRARRRTVLFSTHVMQHAERMCDRVIIIARGKKLFDGSLAEALRTLPHRVRIETDDDVAPLRALRDVVGLEPIEEEPALAVGAKQTRWELELREHADPQAILQTCFASGIRLRRFDHTDPTLHEVFVRLVGPEAREARIR